MDAYVENWNSFTELEKKLAAGSSRPHGRNRRLKILDLNRGKPRKSSPFPRQTGIWLFIFPFQPVSGANPQEAITLKYRKKNRTFQKICEFLSVQYPKPSTSGRETHGDFRRYLTLVLAHKETRFVFHAVIR